MSCKRYFLIPGNNSLSHVVKCLAIGESLTARGHEVRIAVGRKHSFLLQQLSIEHAVLPDIQEADGSAFPSVEWFRRPAYIADCIKSEVDLLKSWRPDRVLGIFRFTLKASAQIAGVPYDSLACGCMLPDSREVLGFAEGEQCRQIQQIILDGFFRYAGSKVGTALTAFGLPKNNGDIRHMLKGERTFLWDFPGFSPLPERADLLHVGPLSWNRWPFDAVDPETFVNSDRPLAVIGFGTCTVCLPVAKRLIRILVDMGYRILLAAGGRKEFLSLMPDDPRVTACTYAPLPEILPHASLLVTHGGQMTVFEALQNEVPVVVMPFQPEQAHSGVCLERIGCGTRLISPRLFQGNPGIYTEALECMTDEEIRSKINGLTDNPMTERHLSEASAIVGAYNGAETIADVLEER